jgi:protoporphyrinogen oxidase/lauroyl/myristoyl acyltransferase
MLRKIKKNLVDVLRLLLWVVVRRIFLLFGVGLIPIIETILAAGAYWFQRNKRRIIREELRRSYGRQMNATQLEAIVQVSFRLYVGFHIRDMFLPFLTPETVPRLLPVEGLHHLEKALEHGQGAVILNPHFGPYLLIMPALGHRGYPIHQIALHADTPEGRTPLDQKVYDIKFQNIQGKMPATFINLAQRSKVREALSALRRNQIVLLPSTGREGLGWADVHLMNRSATLNTGMVKLAQTAGAVLIPAFVIQENPFARVVIEKPIETAGRPIPDILQEYADVLDGYIRNRPEHFCMYLYEMFVHRHWDDHPFFPEKPAEIPKNAVVVGGGIAGLTVGGVLQKEGSRTTIVEKTPSIGGLSRSLTWNGITFDHGPHFLFRENYPDAVAYISQLLGSRLRELDFRIGVSFGRHVYPWPPHIGKMLFRLPFQVALHHLLHPVFRDRPADPSYQSGIQSRHGKYLYELFFGPYIQKKVGIPGSRLHMEWWLKPPRDFSRADWPNDERRIRPKIGRFAEIGMLIRKIFLPGRSRVLVSPDGVQAIPEAMAAHFQKTGGTVRTNTSLTGIVLSRDRVTHVVTESGETLPCDALIWTAPLYELARLLQVPEPDLTYVSIVLAFMWLRGKAHRNNYLYIYYGDSDILFNRAYFPAAVSTDFVPPGTDGVCLEITPGSDFDPADEARLRKRLLQDMEKAGICLASDVIDILLVDIPDAYPLYTLEYSQVLKDFMGRVGRIPNLHVCGRTGGFYNALTDSTVKSALDTAVKVLGHPRSYSMAGGSSKAPGTYNRGNTPRGSAE